MTGIQKVIKYIAIAFAMFIIINIFGGILLGLSILAGISGLDDGEDLPVNEKISQVEDIMNIKMLDIQIKFEKLNIKNGNIFKVESNDSDIYCTENEETIQIRDKSNDWISKNKEVTIYIPEDSLFGNVKIATSAGKVEIELLQTEKLEVEVGAGSTEIRELNVRKEAKINGGAGSFVIDSGIINNLKLKVGAGKTQIQSEILGNSKVESGIGKLDICLIGEDYQIETENGIGAIRINGDKVSNETIYGKGNNILKIEGGIGAINIDFIKD